MYAQSPRYPADPRGATLQGTDLDGAIWSDTTCPDQTNSSADAGSCANHT